jgi:Fe-coproporphyrin III synthase
MLLDKRKLEMLRGPLDLLAISLDGIPASHNRMRASGRAFETMLARLDGVRESGILFGFIFTLTQHNLHELDWVAKFAVDQGARLLQIHPLEIVGRAKTTLGQSCPDQIELAYAFLETQRLKAIIGDRLHVQLDLTSSHSVREEPERIFAGRAPVDPKSQLLADLVSPLVIESDGTVVPTQHGFARRYALGNLYDAPLSDLTIRWRTEGYESFRELCRQVYDDVTAAADAPFVNWYDVLGRKAEGARAG